MAQLYVGMSGYSYPEWQGEGKFYPTDLKKKDYFKYYCSKLNTVEGVGMFYGLPSEKSVHEWIATSPDGFMIAPRMNNHVTHITRLKPIGFGTLRTQMKLVQPLREAGKQGPVLVQLPPNMKRDDQLLHAFLEEAISLGPNRWAMEFRNYSWQAPEIEQMLRDANVSWVAEDTSKADAQRRDTADHVTVRLRREEYTDDQLQEWTAYFCAKVKEGKDCFVYCRHKEVENPWNWPARILELASQSK